MNKDIFLTPKIFIDITLLVIKIFIGIVIFSNFSHAQNETLLPPSSSSKEHQLRIYLKDLVIESQKGTKGQFYDYSQLLSLKFEVGEIMKSLRRTKSTSLLKISWSSLEEEIDSVLSYRQEITTIHINAQLIKKQAVLILAASDELVGLMVENGSSTSDIYVATRQLMLIERAVANLQKITRDDDIPKSFDRFGRDITLFSLIVKSMLNGNKKFRIKRSDAPIVRKQLEKISALFQSVIQQTNEILVSSPGYFVVYDALKIIQEKSQALDQDIAK